MYIYVCVCLCVWSWSLDPKCGEPPHRVAKKSPGPREARPKETVITVQIITNTSTNNNINNSVNVYLQYIYI